ncbi:hypothetical protein DFH09DRAFT_928827 [Mycena vulgaris]|nr:hypothetical protein DFH09DRAFT_928827 [Mycena vulgaris]
MDVTVDAKARVLSSEAATPIPGLWAASEVIGGAHGRNRPEGSSLLEAVVFGAHCRSGAAAADEWIGGKNAMCSK